MGGEKIASCTVCRVSMGSPPRGRGKARCAQPRDARNRITPAWAGKRHQTFGMLVHPWDHPRVGGEKKNRRRCAVDGIGSPPRGRGKASAPCQFVHTLRITPAWAGKSPPTCDILFSDQDHPRVGGEKSLLMNCGISTAGSPPRGRGKVSHNRGTKQRHRITPAWAGKSPDKF